MAKLLKLNWNGDNQDTNENNENYNDNDVDEVMEKLKKLKGAGQKLQWGNGWKMN